MNLIQLKKSGDDLIVTVQGDIDNSTQLPEFPEVKGSVTIKFSGSNYINSAGVRNWVTWMTRSIEQLKGATICFEQIPSNFVKQAANLKEFLPAGSKVKSFVVPYYCNHCSQNSEALMTWGKDIDPSDDPNNLSKLISERKCDNCGQMAEIDAVPEHFIMTRQSP